MQVDLPEDRNLDVLYTPKVADMLHILRDQIKIAQGRGGEVH
jgi:NitT/TauT family transport system ATP-binding protein